MSKDHEVHMRRAIELARAQAGRTGVNPPVGCVIIGPDGKRISEGATADGGTPHAEEMALGAQTVENAKGAVAYVTLEPCRERSKGGASCSQRLIEAGVASVVIAVMDRHPNGSGGAAALEKAGIAVETGLLAPEAAPLYEEFFAALD